MKKTPHSRAITAKETNEDSAIPHVTRMNNAIISAEQLAEKHRFIPTTELQDLLVSIDEDAYGRYSPDENEIQLCRVFGTEALSLLRNICHTAIDLKSIELSTYDGVLDFAVADFNSTKGMEDVLGAIAVLANVRERDMPLRSNRKLAKYIVNALGCHWSERGGLEDAAAFRDFVEDALHGRRRFSAGVIPHAVEQFTSMMAW